ncbi:non-homologous end-joining DNA ligase [Salinisphaera orenii]|uniref:DNA ligase (ATP) n=1 Tax=Salinisphaera orenii YIM 95161 TaxID=1051139 RepID=A0A423Q0V6_9GAMM|nr:non-homologous end-joining DNA ligase [Salinisphaera halophila]ROO31860.1 ATP-dependent DNA ligase [Salinisphaera halophila YIM 95161]
MADWRDELPDHVLDVARRSRMPRHFEPMLATLADTPFSDDDWLFERKFDGIRLLVFRDGDHVELLTRNGQSRNDHFPELVDAFAAQPHRRFVLDGEVVAFDGHATSFARLQQRAGISEPQAARDSGIAIHFYAFDCPWLDGLDLRRVALRDRKNLLRGHFSFGGRLRYAAHRNGVGEAYHAEACRKGWEGVLAKQADSPYRRGRSQRWLKLKCSQGQELVIGGYTEPQGSRSGFGALLVGYYEDDALRYAGRVGTGFDEAELTRLHDVLASLERATPPFADAPSERGVHWVEPERVAEVAFTEWTEDGRLRHPSYVGERDDKDPREVVREVAPART